MSQSALYNYEKVKNDITLLPDVLAYYDAEYEKANKEIAMYGNMIKQASQLPALYEYRFRQLQELETILEHTNILLEEVEAELYRKYMECYNKVLSSRDIEKYIHGEKSYVEMRKIVNEVLLRRNMFVSISKGFDTKNWMLGHITKLKTAGLDDAEI